MLKLRIGEKIVLHRDGEVIGTVELARIPRKSRAVLALDFDDQVNLDREPVFQSKQDDAFEREQQALADLRTEEANDPG